MRRMEDICPFENPGCIVRKPPDMVSGREQVGSCRTPGIWLKCQMPGQPMEFLWFTIGTVLNYIRKDMKNSLPVGLRMTDNRLYHPALH